MNTLCTVRHIATTFIQLERIRAYTRYLSLRVWIKNWKAWIWEPPKWLPKPEAKSCWNEEQDTAELGQSRILQIGEINNTQKSGRVSAYFIFDRETRHKVYSTHPGYKLGDVSRIIGQRWRDLPLEAKEEYGNRARMINEKRRQYAAGTGGGTQSTQASIRAERLTPYLLFDREKRDYNTKKHPDLRFGEISKLIGQQWRELTIVQKEEYHKRAVKLNLHSPVEIQQETYEPDWILPIQRSCPAPQAHDFARWVQCAYWNTILENRHAYREHVLNTHYSLYNTTFNTDDEWSQEVYESLILHRWKLWNNRYECERTAKEHLQATHPVIYSSRQETFMILFASESRISEEDKEEETSDESDSN